MSGMLVSPAWLQKVDDHINNRDIEKRLTGKDLSYVVRPAKLTSAFVNGKATANLIINGQESSQAVDVYDVTGQANAVGLTTGSYCYIAYRGKWEIVSSFASGGSSNTLALNYSQVTLNAGSFVIRQIQQTVCVP